MFQIGEKVSISITREESNLELASESAWQTTRYKFGIDEVGNVGKVDGFDPNEHCVFVQFSEYRRVVFQDSIVHMYDFVAWCGV